MLLLVASVISLLVPTCYAFGSVAVQFSQTSKKPVETSHLTDDFISTCQSLVIDPDTNLQSLTMFRMTNPNTASTSVNVSLTGNNVRFYVTRITSADRVEWLGRWNSCPLIYRLTSGDIETCDYECQCPESCLEIQVIRIASSLAESSWTLCDVALTTPTVIDQCSEVTVSGVYRLLFRWNDVTTYRYIYCDTKTDGGSWMVMLRRQDGSVEFYREWQDYKNGFGSLDSEFWAGNELMYQLTNNGRKFTMRIDLTNYAGDSIFAKFSDFSVGSEYTNYTLHATGFDPSSTVHDKMKYQTGCQFSTAGRDNDRKTENLAMALQAPFWYCYTTDIVLTGHYGQASEISSGFGIKWYGPWSQTTYAKYAVMMIRPN